MTATEPLRAWLVLAFGEDRQYAGNAGYEDVVATSYRYDNFVPNHKKVAAGDLFIILGNRELVGLARVETLDVSPGKKQRARCPACRTTAIKARANRTPKFRCNQGHEFDEPLYEEIAVTTYTAGFGETFLPTRGLLSLADLRSACPKWNGQLAMQGIDSRFSGRACEKFPGS